MILRAISCCIAVARAAGLRVIGLPMLSCMPISSRLTIFHFWPISWASRISTPCARACASTRHSLMPRPAVLSLPRVFRMSRAHPISSLESLRLSLAARSRATRGPRLYCAAACPRCCTRVPRRWPRWWISTVCAMFSLPLCCAVMGLMDRCTSVIHCLCLHPMCFLRLHPPHFPRERSRGSKTIWLPPTAPIALRRCVRGTRPPMPGYRARTYLRFVV